MEHNEAKQYSHNGDSRRRKKGAENIFKAIMVENILNIGRNRHLDPCSRKDLQCVELRPTIRHITVKLSKVSQRKDFESSRRKKRSYAQGNFHKTADGLPNNPFQSRKE